MSWADDLIAGPLGFTYCALFPRAREAIKAWTEITGRPVNLPSNICPIAKDWAKSYIIHEIDETGLAPGITTQLYGYREEGDGNSELDLDPLGTGFFSRPCATSAIVSFGEKKFITPGGAAFATKDLGLAQEMEKRAYIPAAFVASLKVILDPESAFLGAARHKRRERVYLWDRYLGDSLQRIKREQVVPWRAMRLCPIGKRQNIVDAVRDEGHDIGTNYPCLPGWGFGTAGKFFGDRVINLFVSDDYDEPRIKTVCEIIKSALREPKRRLCGP